MAQPVQIKAPRGDILRHKARFKVLATGRRWGKTHLALLWLHSGIFHPAEIRWFIAPTYRQARMIAWPLLIRYYRSWDWLPGLKLNHTELTAILPNGAMVALKGADNADALRGVGLTRAVLDEYAFMKANVWPEVIRPTLSDTGGKAFFIGTPDGLNHFYDLFQRGQDPTEKDWQSWQYRSIDGGYIPADEIAAARRDLDARTFRQEYEASFETIGLRVYYAFDRARHVQQRADLGRAPVVIGMDFNVAKMCATIGRKLTDGIHWEREVVLRDSDTFQMARALQQYRGATIYPDPAGAARKTSATKSDHQILRDAGFQVVAPRSAPAVRDRVNAVNGLLQNSEGKVRMTVDPGCRELIADLERVQWHNGDLDKRDPERTHISDAAGYAVSYLFGLARRQAVSVGRYA